MAAYDGLVHEMFYAIPIEKMIYSMYVQGYNRDDEKRIIIIIKDLNQPGLHKSDQSGKEIIHES